MPLTQRNKSKPIDINVSSLPARVDIWNVRSPHVGPGTPLSNSPFGLRTPPKTPPGGRDDLPPVPQKPRSPVRRIRRLSSGSSIDGSHDCVLESMVHDDDYGDAAWGQHQVSPSKRISPTMRVVDSPTMGGLAHFKQALSPLRKTPMLSPRVGPANDTLHQHAEAGRVSLEMLDLSSNSLASMRDMDCSHDTNRSGTPELIKSWREKDSVAAHLCDSMLSDVATAAKRMRIAEHSPVSAAAAASSQALDTPMPATRLFHRPFDEAGSSSNAQQQQQQNHNEEGSSGDLFRFGGMCTPTHQSICSSAGGYDSPSSGIASADASMRTMSPFYLSRFSEDPNISRRYTLSPAALQRPSWQKVRSYTHGSPHYFRKGPRRVGGTPEVASFSDNFFGFHEIGRGSFGKVFRCVRKLDLHPYAVKEVVREYGSIRDRERMLKEVYALSSVRDNVHIVRYFSSWEEDGKLYIQTELCSGTLAQRKNAHGPLDDTLLRTVTSHIATGLSFIHSSGMVHLDIKPENIYTTEAGIYKIGDLGLASPADARNKAEEGDKRYLSRELLQSDDACDLRAADVFSLGASLYESASPSPLPSSGDAYHQLRDGLPPPLPGCISQEMQGIMVAMMHPNPPMRPTASQVSEHAGRGEVLPCLSSCLVDQSEGGINFSQFAKESDAIKMRERAKIAENQVVSLEEKLRATLEEVMLWKERAQKINCSRKGGFSASMDLHTLAPVGSSPLQSPVMRSPLMASDTHGGDVPQFEIQDVVKRVKNSRLKKESSMDEPGEGQGDEAVDAGVGITSPPVRLLGGGVSDTPDDKKLRGLRMEMDGVSYGASPVMDPSTRSLRLNARLSSVVEAFMQPQP